MLEKFRANVLRKDLAFLLCKFSRVVLVNVSLPLLVPKLSSSASVSL